MRIFVLLYRVVLGWLKPKPAPAPSLEDLEREILIRSGDAKRVWGGFSLGDQVKMKGGCPHAWNIYAAWPYSRAIHIERWDSGVGKFVRVTFVDPGMLVKI